MELLKKEFVKFDYVYCRSLLESEKIDEAKQYVNCFFFRYRDNVFFFDGSTFLLYPLERAIKLIPCDLKIEINVLNELKSSAVNKKYDKIKFRLADYLKETDFMKNEYTPTIDFKKDLIFTEKVKLRGYEFEKKYINMAKPLRIDICIKSKRNEKTKTDIKLIYNHIKEVLCSSNEDVYEYVLNWLACTFGGRKLRKALYIESNERTGKGIIFNDLLKAILGDRMHKTNSNESITKYTKPFEGCCLIQPDELPHCDDFKGLQDALKGLVTEPKFTCRSMWEQGYEQENTFNIAITTNNNALSLSQTNKSRWMCLDVSECKLGQTDYFKKLAKILSDNNILLIFYEDMIERFKTLDNWNEDILPVTESNKTKIIEGLPQIYKYLKEHFIINKKDLNMRTDLFLSEYRLVTKDKTSNQKLGRYLTKLGIVGIKNSKNQGYNYKMTADEMLKVYQDNNWMDDNIDFINADKTTTTKGEIEYEEEKIKYISNKDIEIRGLKQQIEDLRVQLLRKPLVPKTDKHIQEEIITKEWKSGEEIESLDDIIALENTIKNKKKTKSTIKTFTSEDEKLAEQLAELEKELFDDLI